MNYFIQDKYKFCLFWTAFIPYSNDKVWYNTKKIIRHELWNLSSIIRATPRFHLSIVLIVQNKKVRYDYEILEKFEAGIVLQGSEVKALRAKRANLNDAFCRFIKGELHLMNAHISELETTNRHFSRDCRTPRKLLLHKKQVEKIYIKIHKEGLTVVPLMLYFNERNLVKVSIAIAKGKKLHDKRADLKAKTLDREANQAIKNRSF